MPMTNFVPRTVAMNTAVAAGIRSRKKKEEEAKIEALKATPEWKSLQELNKEIGIVENNAAPQTEKEFYIGLTIWIVLLLFPLSVLFMGHMGFLDDKKQGR